MPGQASFDVAFWTRQLWRLERRESQLLAGELGSLTHGDTAAITDARYAVAQMLRDHQAGRLQVQL